MLKVIVFGSLLAVFMLAMLPSVSAVEYKISEETNREQILEKLESYIEILKEKSSGWGFPLLNFIERLIYNIKVILANMVILPAFFIFRIVIWIYGIIHPPDPY